MRGKDFTIRTCMESLVGSPPRAREGHMRYKASKKTIRITPACAGRTLPESSLKSTSWDHPRVRGKDVDVR